MIVVSMAIATIIVIAILWWYLPRPAARTSRTPSEKHKGPLQTCSQRIRENVAKLRYRLTVGEGFHPQEMLLLEQKFEPLAQKWELQAQKSELQAQKSERLAQEWESLAQGSGHLAQESEHLSQEFGLLVQEYKLLRRHLDHETREQDLEVTEELVKRLETPTDERQRLIEKCPDVGDSLGEHIRKQDNNSSRNSDSHPLDGTQSRQTDITTEQVDRTAASPPIRVGIIGLSASAVTSWASSAHLPYLLSPRGRKRFEIVALLNSSVEAAQAAITTYGFDESRVKAYGDPAALAADQNVELVVCVTRVDKHYPTVLPSVEAGKAVFVEWPLAENADKARELAQLANEKGGKTVVGLQGRLAPVVRKIKEVIDSGRIGKVLSVEVRAAGGTNDRAVMPVGLEYFTQLEVGGNPITIGFGHVWDFVQSAIGEATNVNALAQIQRPTVPLRDPGTNTIVRTTTSNVPDLVHATATLATSPTVQSGASFAFTFRRGQPYPGDLPLVWTVHGETGELRVLSPGGTGLHANAYSDGAKVTLEVHDFASGAVDEVKWEWETWQKELPVVARSVAAVYEEFAKGEDEEGKRGWVNFDEAVVRHEQLGKLLKGRKGE